MLDAIFIILAVLTVGSAFYVSISKNIVYSAFSLLLTLSGVGGLYILLSADFLAGVQLLLYVGGVLVLILFAVMITMGIDNTPESNPSRFSGFAVFLVSLFATLWIILIYSVPNPYKAMPMRQPITKSVGMELLANHLLPFEVISLLLLVGLIGAVSIARVASHGNQERGSGISKDPSSSNGGSK